MDLIHHPKAAYHPPAPSWLLPALLGPGWLGIAPNNSDEGKQKALWLCPNPAVTRTPGSRVGFPSPDRHLFLRNPLPLPEKDISSFSDSGIKKFFLGDPTRNVTARRISCRRGNSNPKGLG